MIRSEYYQSSACNLDFWRVPPPPPLCVPLSWPVWTSSFMSECVCVNERRWMSVCVWKLILLFRLSLQVVAAARRLGVHCGAPSLLTSAGRYCASVSLSRGREQMTELITCWKKKSLRCQCVYFHEQICVTCACVCATHVMNKPRVTSFWSVTYISKRSPWKELTGGN